MVSEYTGMSSEQELYMFQISEAVFSAARANGKLKFSHNATDVLLLLIVGFN